MPEVPSRENSQEIHVGTGALDQLDQIISRRLPFKHCAIITDTNVRPIFGDSIQRVLTRASLKSVLIAIPAGEKSKNLEQVGAICDQMVAAGLDRQSFVIGVGGGVIGDISGFVAAIYHRGIPHVQIPTTLLAMVDSSIGGKTGVNTSAGKNLIGAVHPPALVIDDVDVLKTLPRREFNQGLAEIIKHAIIADTEMFEQLEVAQASGLQTKENASETLAPLIRRNIDIKTRIVSDDHFDRAGQRALLNFGHTIGHAIERAGDYQGFLHGEAISLGMVAACTVSMKRAGFSAKQHDAVVNLLNRFDLPTQLPADFPKEPILAAIPLDKKFEGGQVRFVVTPKIGAARLSSDVTMDDIREVVETL